MITEFSQWRKLHRHTSLRGSFKIRSRAAIVRRFPDKTVYRCPVDQELFEKPEINRIKPPKIKIWPKRSFKSFKKRTPREKSDNQKTLTRLDKLWTKIIKLRANHQSEFSGNGHEEGHLLHAHHILGKSSHALRYSLDNGICVTGLEHTELAHGPAAPALKFEEWAISYRGTTRESLLLLQNQSGQTDLEEIEFFLKESLKNLMDGQP